MRNIKKSITLIIILALSLVIFSACGSEDKTSEGADGVVELKFLHKWPQPEYSVYFDDIIKKFEAENENIKIKVEAVGDEPIKDKLRILMGTDTQPDIFFTWSGEFATKFITSGNSLDLTDALNSNPEWKNSIMEAGLEPFTYEGKTYGIPLRINGKFFVYNTEIFEKYNLEKPETWEEFLLVLETLKSNDVTPIGFGNIFPWAGSHYLTGLNQKFVAQEVRLKDYNPKTGEFTDPGYVKALEYFKELNDKGYFNNGVNSTEHNMASEMFYGEEVAMVYVELEEFSEMEEGLPGKWDFFAMPEITEGKGNKNFLTGAPDGFMISGKTKHPEEAIKFLQFLTNMESSLELVEVTGWPSPIIGAVSPENSNQYLVEGMNAIAEAEGMALWLDTDIHIKISDVYLPNLQELLNGTKTPEQIMIEVQEMAKEVQKEAE